MNTIVYYKNRSLAFHASVAEALPHLQELKQENNRAAFDSAIKKVLPQVKRYINRQLTAALKTNTLSEGKYKVEDFIDQLYIVAYENIQNLTDKQDLHRWLFSQADKILEDVIIEEIFDSLFFRNIDNYTKAEWDEMEERFSTDGDGDLVMEEELDDNSYSKNDYILEDVFIEDKDKDIIENLNAKLQDEQISRHINIVLHELPFPIRTIFDLSVRQAFLPDEIAEIKQIPTEEVEQRLSHARKSIRISFEKRFSMK